MTVNEAIRELTKRGVKYSNLAETCDDVAKQSYAALLSREFSEVANELMDEENANAEVVFVENDETKIEQDMVLFTGNISMFRVDCNAYGCLRIIIKIDIPLLS